MKSEIIQGDALEVLASMAAESVQCCITSPPYWGLRDYGVDGQLGLEPTPEEYVAKMVAVFREVKRVLRKDATLWLNMGDSYARQGGSQEGYSRHWDGRDKDPGMTDITHVNNTGLKPKDLCGIPWRLAFALQADGWWLRQDIIWHKPNPMPESCTDRCTKAHEYLFLLTKAARYYYDAEAIRESAEYGYCPTTKGAFADSVGGRHNESTVKRGDGTGGRNKRSVWTIPTHAFPDAHFATFPPALVEPCILAGTSEHGCCPECGTPWERVVEKERTATRNVIDVKADDTGKANRDPGRHCTTSNTTGWQPGCKCASEDNVPCVVLDPFCGSGTTGMVAHKLQRDFVGIELSSEYAEMARKRVGGAMPLFTEASG